MIVGSLGSIPFYTNVNESVLISGIEWDSTARYAEHTRHNQMDMLEYVGDNPDKITFEIKLSAFLGVNPVKMLDRLTSTMKQREAVKFVLGTMPIPGHWVITNLDRSLEYFHRDGTLLSTDVKITLMEYIDTVQMPVISNRVSFTDRMASAIVVSPSPGADRSPVIPPTTQPVSMGRKPATKTPPPPKKQTQSLLGTVVGLGVKAVKTVSNVVKKYNVVEVLKNAFSNRNYDATKAKPATPVVTRPNSGVNPNSSKHASWIHTVK